MASLGVAPVAVFDEPLPVPADDDPLPIPPGDDLPIPGGDLPPIPGGDLPPPIPGDSQGPPAPPGKTGQPEKMLPDKETADLPVFGKIKASDVGMPLFTIAIGLVDGFNPCAMWVLLFLLSMLVNLKSRSKMFAIAGIFVFISGAAYFAFMAAWLEVLQYGAALPWVQRTLGILAVVVGSIHIKDFFAFKKGVSLSIPESAKSSINARIRNIITAETFWGAIAGAIVLAVLVNFIELLCTAGLPTLYTNVLTLQGYPAWKNYAYIGLYILCYMFDDSVMVGIAVATMGKRRLEEKEGRWLKLISGLLIFALGVVLLVKPEWLQ